MSKNDNPRIFAPSRCAFDPDNLTPVEAMKIIAAVVMQATGTEENDITEDLRISNLTREVLYAALYALRECIVHLTNATELEIDF